MEVLLHASTIVGGWRASQLHEALLVHFGLPTQRYGVNQLRYDLRKMRTHGLLERDGTRYAYRLHLMEEHEEESDFHALGRMKEPWRLAASKSSDRYENEGMDELLLQSTSHSCTTVLFTSCVASCVVVSLDSQSDGTRLILASTKSILDETGLH